jgi:hypothetical protein
MDPTFTLKSKIWLWKGKAAWHFITIPKKLSTQIKSFDIPRKGFGSIKVKVTIGKTTWTTSIFPSKTGEYILPLKKEVRKKETLKAKDKVELTFSLQ